MASVITKSVLAIPNATISTTMAAIKTTLIIEVSSMTKIVVATKPHSWQPPTFPEPLLPLWLDEALGMACLDGVFLTLQLWPVITWYFRMTILSLGSWTSKVAQARPLLWFQSLELPHTAHLWAGDGLQSRLQYQQETFFTGKKASGLWEASLYTVLFVSTTLFTLCDLAFLAASPLPQWQRDKPELLESLVSGSLKATHSLRVCSKWLLELASLFQSFEEDLLQPDIFAKGMCWGLRRGICLQLLNSLVVCHLAIWIYNNILDLYKIILKMCIIPDLFTVHCDHTTPHTTLSFWGGKCVYIFVYSTTILPPTVSLG